MHLALSLRWLLLVISILQNFHIVTYSYWELF